MLKGSHVAYATLLLVAMTLPVHVNPLPSAGKQALLCPAGCLSSEHEGSRRVPFLKYARDMLVRPRASLSFPLPRLPASLLEYIASLRGIRGGAAVSIFPPSDFSRMGLSDLGQTSTATPDREYHHRTTNNAMLAFNLRESTVVEDLYKMKLKDLQRALESRGLRTSGLKSELVDRLQLHMTENPNPDRSDSKSHAKRHLRDGKTDETGPSMTGTAATKKRALMLAEPLRHRRKLAPGLELLQEVKTVQHADYLFEIFPTQAEAFQFADARPGLGLQVYSQDRCSTGAKSYVVATTQGFWRTYQTMSSCERHFGLLRYP